MNTRTLQPATLVWAILIFLTVVGFIVIDYSLRSTLGVAIVMLLSAVKVRLVLYHFMELSGISKGLQIFFNIWLLLCPSMIFLLYWLAI